MGYQQELNDEQAGGGDHQARCDREVTTDRDHDLHGEHCCDHHDIDGHAEHAHGPRHDSAGNWGDVL